MPLTALAKNGLLMSGMMTPIVVVLPVIMLLASFVLLFAINGLQRWSESRSAAF